MGLNSLGLGISGGGTIRVASHLDVSIEVRSKRVSSTGASLRKPKIIVGTVIITK